MKNPERIDRILKLIKYAWKNNPDFRLGQLIKNCFHHTEDLYYIEDKELERKLRQVYKIFKGDKQ